MFRDVRLVTGMPRSGTSWVAQIVDSSPRVRFRMSPMFSWPYKNAIDETSTGDDWLRVLEGAYHSDDEFMDQTYNRRSGEYPTFADKEPEPPFLVIKFTRFHNLLERAFEVLPELRGVTVVRHPCGAIHSWLTAPGEFPPDADPLEHWRSGEVKKTGYGEFWGFEDWKRVTRLHVRLAREMPDRFMLVRYEALVRDPEPQARAILEFLDIPWSEQTRSFLEASRSRHDPGSYSVFKSPAVADRWRAELQPEIAAAIQEELKGTDLEEFLA